MQPMPRLTPAGQALVLSFVDYHAQFPNKQNLKAWIRHVERMRQSSPPWKSVVLMIPSSMTASGRSESITIYQTLFRSQSTHAASH